MEKEYEEPVEAKQVAVSASSDVAVAESVKQLTAMINKSVSWQTKMMEQYTALSEGIVGIFSQEYEDPETGAKDRVLDKLDYKELMNLFDKISKAQSKPIQDLTTLVQAIDTMRNTSQMKTKLEELSAVVDELKRAKDAKDTIEEAVVVETTPTTIDAVINE